MRILYLFGNGFDLHVGLNTGYPDFLKYYLDQPYPSAISDIDKLCIKRLKDDINKKFNLWSQLELRFGQHMAQLGKTSSDVRRMQFEFDIVNDDIREKLSEYIAKQDKRSVFADNAKKQFLNDIVAPERHLRDFEKEQIENNIKSIWLRTPNVIDIITFNYTRTIEHLIGQPLVQTSSYEVHEPIHVHGYYDSRMVLGVNDASQIENDQLRRLTYVTNALVKPANNHTYGVAHTNKCSSLINNAQLICCYGLSFGETDKIWWKKICDELLNRSDLYVIIYSYVDKMPNFANNGHKLEYQMQLAKDKLLSNTGLEEPLKSSIAQRIFVSINDSIFNIKVDDRTPEETLMGKSAPNTLERLVETIEAINLKDKNK